MTAYLERYRDIVDDWPAFADAVRLPLPVGVWARPGRMDRATLSGALAELGLVGRPTPWNPDGLALPADSRPGMSWPYLAGLCHVQEEVATAAVRLLAPRPGERVLDLCAAPGNKTAQIATVLGARGTVVARELDVSRMAALRNAVERLGLLNVATSPGDGADPAFTRACAGAFDAVLADVPCTSEGTVRRSRRVLRRCSPERSRGMQADQVRLLRAAVATCRPGGRAVYATCTFAPEENEAVVDAVLREADGALAVRPASLAGLRAAPGLTEWEGRAFDASLSGALRIWPHLNDTGGFFIAVLDVLDRPPWAERADRASLAPVDLGVPADADPAVDSIVEHFGVPPETLEGIRIVRRNRLGLHAVAADHAPPPSIELDSAGFLFLRDDGRVPKLTTAGALAIGGSAKRRALEVDGASAAAFVARKAFAVAGGSAEDGSGREAPGRGYVLPRFRGYPLGVGWTDGADEHGRSVVESLYPKGWGAGGGG